MSYTGGGSRRIEDAEVDAFCAKLEQWAEGLEPAEQSLARLMLARARRAREVDGEDLTYESRERWDELIESVFRELVRAKPEYTIDIEAGIAYVKDGTGRWVKGAWVDTADVSTDDAAADEPGQDLAGAGNDAPPPVEDFAQQLEAHAQTLAPRERETLQLLLLRAMDPVERIRWTSAPDLLDDGQEALLEDLDERHRDSEG